MSRRGLPAALTLLVMGWGPATGCGKLQELLGDDAQGGSAGAGSSEQAAAQCGGPEFPCRWDAVTAQVVERIQAVAGEALGWRKAGLSAEAIATKLGAADDVVVLGFSDDSIRYRVKGGRPAWVFLATAGSLPTKGAIHVPSRLPTGAATWMGEHHGPVSAVEPGTKPKKKALILSPFRWQWQLSGKEDGEWIFDDEVESLAETFNEVGDYNGGVVLKQNIWVGNGVEFGVSTSDFASWKDYDVIHVSTHGTSCDKPTRRCLTSLATGELWPDPVVKPAPGLVPQSDPNFLLKQALSDDLLSQGFDMGFMPVSGADASIMERLGLRVIVEVDHQGAAGPQPGAQESALMASNRSFANHFAGPFVLVNSHFFEQTYQDKLADKIIFLSACKSGTKSDLIDALTGPATAVIGWNKVMRLGPSAKAAESFWNRMTDPGRKTAQGSGAQGPNIDGGVRVSEAFGLLERLSDGAAVARYGPTKSILIEGVVTEDDVTGAKIEASGDITTRAREIIRLRTDGGEAELEDGGLVTLVGTPGDGKPDKLAVVAEVVGVAETDKSSDFVVHVDVDSRTASGTLVPDTQVRSGTWHASGEIELGFDLTQPTFVLEPWVELPDGGTSRWYYENIGVQYFTFTVTGPAFSGPQTFSIPPDRISMTVFETAVSMTYLDEKTRAASSQDTTILGRMSWGISPEPPVNLAGGTFEFGGKDGGWASRMVLQGGGCPDSTIGCKMLNLRGQSGEVKVTRFDLGAHVTRPNLEGPTIIAGEIKGTFRAAAIAFEDEIFEVEGRFALAD